MAQCNWWLEQLYSRFKLNLAHVFFVCLTAKTADIDDDSRTDVTILFPFVLARLLLVRSARAIHAPLISLAGANTAILPTFWHDVNPHFEGKKPKNKNGPSLSGEAMIVLGDYRLGCRSFFAQLLTIEGIEGLFVRLFTACLFL